MSITAILNIQSVKKISLWSEQSLSTKENLQKSEKSKKVAPVQDWEQSNLFSQLFIPYLR